VITKLIIENFKSHSNTELNLSKINILTGLNGMGKSSVIQALLLLRQSNKLNKGLELNDELCSIGVVEDAVYQSAEEDYIKFSINHKQDNFVWKFSANPTNINDTFLSTLKDSVLPNDYSSINLFNNNFQYISAFRNGPTDDYIKNTSAVEHENQISKNEGRCEFVVHYLDFFGKTSIHQSLKKNIEDDATLVYQVKQWMREISPNININIKPSGLNYKIDYSFDRGEGQIPTLDFKAKNIGFGISYVLPIIVASLHAPEGSIVIIENPEAHIHPGAQAKLMELICKSAKNGVQFIIETHSDHIINGLLVATKNNIISKEDSSVYYFDRDEKKHATQAIHLPVLNGGKIQRPPEGFFDQLDKDMNTLMGF
jgi:predicted ATPase